jgi:hypothetical protein
MNRKASIVMGSLVGACVLNLLFVACGSPTNAQAQAQASACTSWQMATFYQPNVLTRSGTADWPAGLSSMVNLPNGWEPIEATAWGGTNSSTSTTVGALVIVRHCAQ